MSIPHHSQPQTYFIELSKNENSNFGFNIKGGIDFGCPVHIWRVEPNSIAGQNGLRSRDEIISANGIDFCNITHADALKVLKNKQILKLHIRPANSVLNAKKLPSNIMMTGQESSNSNLINRDNPAYYGESYYTWIDRHGNIVDPPSMTGHNGDLRSISANRVNKYEERRLIELVIEVGQNLGLMIRGGAEYGLGIYVTGVDRGSVAEACGLRRGDEIISVNGQNFTNITHDKAVQILKSSRKMNIVASFIGKIPAADLNETITRSDACNPNTNLLLNHHTTGNFVGDSSLSMGAEEEFLADDDDMLLLDYYNKSSSSDLNMKSSENKRRLRQDSKCIGILQMIEEKARTVLTKSEHSRFTFYRIEYTNGFLTIETFVKILLELLSTSEKFTLLTEVRELIRPNDRPLFDDLIYKPRQPGMMMSSSNNKLMETSNNLKNSYGMENLMEDEEMKVGNQEDLIFLRDYNNPNNPNNIPNNKMFGNNPIEENNLSQTPGAQPGQPNRNNCIRFRVRVSKIKPNLGITIEGGVNTPHRLPRIIDIHPEGCAYSNLKPGQVLLTVDGTKLDGMSHEDIVAEITNAFTNQERTTVDFIVVENRGN